MRPDFDTAKNCDIYYTVSSCYNLVLFCNDVQQ